MYEFIQPEKKTTVLILHGTFTQKKVQPKGEY